MKPIYSVIILCCLLLTGCKKSGNEESSGGSPTAPKNPVPANGTIGVSLPVTLFWTASTDPEGGPVEYDVYLGTDSLNLTVVMSGLSDNFYQTDPLLAGVKYFWKVVAKDNQAKLSAGPLWRFTTADIGPGSEYPQTPRNPHPSDGSAGVSPSIILSWSKCPDPQGDPVTYDLYLDSLPGAPVLIQQDLPDTIYNPGNLNILTKYYWKVVAKDNHNNFSSGPVWNFTTGDFDYGSFTDPRDNRVYRTIVINGVTWMADNLAWTPSDITGWKYPGGDAANDPDYGKLYENVFLYYNNVAPTGWHVATQSDYDALFSFLGGTYVAGGKLKETGYTHWDWPNTDATNVAGLDVRGAGQGGPLRTLATFITGEPDGIGFKVFTMSNDSHEVLSFYVSTTIHGETFFSVRCVKN
jgi:uncharacterized protein (TIGR02145 family)